MVNTKSSNAKERSQAQTHDEETVDNTVAKLPERPQEIAEESSRDKKPAAGKR